MKHIEAQVIATFGRSYQVKTPDGLVFLSVSRGKKREAVCGDWVSIKPTVPELSNDESHPQGVIEKIQTRRSLLYRSDMYRQKQIAANVDQLLIVVAGNPSFDEELVSRCLIAAHSQDITPIIVLNKTDLIRETEQTKQRLAYFQQIGYQILPLSAKQQCDQLLQQLHGHISVLVGQSGMGKSTIINQLIPEANTRTREVSSALDSGKHTTTHSTLYQLDNNTQIIDCPGVQAFGLNHLDYPQIEQAFIEFRPLLGHCRFSNCRHQHEPDCAIKQAVDSGKIARQRLQHFYRISSELASKR